MILTEIIRTRSRRWLRRKINERGLKKSGSNDTDNQPGKTTLSQEADITLYETNIQHGEVLNVNSAGGGKGSVDAPLETPIPVLTQDMAPYPHALGDRRDVVNKGLSDLGQFRGINTGAVDDAPSSSNNTGSVTIEVDRTTGKDPDRVKRTRERHNSRRGR